MMGNKLLFTSLVKHNKESVTFGDGATIKLCSKGAIDCVSMPNFDNILYVAGTNRLIPSNDAKT